MILDSVHQETTKLSFSKLTQGGIVQVKTYVNNESKELIGGDLILQQSFPIEYKNSKLFKNLKGIEFSEKIQTIVSASDIKSNFISLASVRVVENNYPLYGNLETQNNSGNYPKTNQSRFDNHLRI